MKSIFDAQNINLSPEQLSQLEQYYELLIEENEKYNLTAITEKNEVYVKHFLDSLLISQLPLDLSQKKIIDIGTGAGFPAIPIMIKNPDVQMTCLDALNKRIGFIQKVCEQLDIKGLKSIHGRAESFGQDPLYREQYDFVISRAVAELRLLLEYAIPFLKVNGYFIAYKSLKSSEEIKNAEKALKELNAEIIDIHTFTLPDVEAQRDLIIIKKKSTTKKKYPRKPGTPKKSPL